MNKGTTIVEAMEANGVLTTERKSSLRNYDAQPGKVEVPEMTFDYQSKNELPALTLNDATMILRGEVAALLASPGVGKTTLTGGMAAAHLASRYNLSNVDSFGFRFNSTGKKCLLCDTERTADDCSKTYHDIYKRIGKPSSVLSPDGSKIDGLTHLVMSEVGETEALRAAVEHHVSTGEYELIILDGILDFCLSMLDDKDATKVVKWVRSLAVKYDCAIVCTIHPNKGTDNPAGHIGAFLYRWCRAFLLIRSTADKGTKEITTDFQYAKLSHANIAAFEPVYFGWNDSLAMMTTCDAPAAPTYKISYLKQAVIELRLSGTNEIPASTLKELYGKLAGVTQPTAKKHIYRAVEDGLLIPSGQGKATRYLPSSDWHVSVTHSDTNAPHINGGAYPNGDTHSAEYPNGIRINSKGYPQGW